MATRLWTPADMVGVTGLEYTDSTKSVTTSDGTFAAGTPVTGVMAQRPEGGTATAVVSFRDDFRPVIGALNGKQAITFDTATRQLDIPTKTNLPSGDGDKFWFSVDKIDETRTDDRYTWGYGGTNGSGVAYRMRQGAIPYSDIGSVGYSIGTVAIAATGISIISEQYTKSDTTSRASYNGGAWAAYVRARNTSLSQSAHFGNWPVYGNGTNHRKLRRGWGNGTPSADDWARLQGWASWDTGDNGASLVAGHPYKNAAPTVTDGATAISGSGTASFGPLASAATAKVALRASAAAAFAPLSGSASGQLAIRSTGAGVLGPLVSSGASRLALRAAGAAAFGPLTSGSGARVAVRATAAGAFGPLGSASSGKVALHGAGAASFGPLVGTSSSGSRPSAYAAAAASFAPLRGTATARVAIRGAGAGVFGPLGGSSDTRVRISGAGVARLGALIGAGRAQTPIYARQVAALAPIVGASYGRHPVRGAASGVLGPLVGASGGRSDAGDIRADPCRTLTAIPQNRYLLASPQSRVLIARKVCV